MKSFIPYPSCLYPCKMLHFKTSVKCPRCSAGMLFDSITDQKIKTAIKFSIQKYCKTWNRWKNKSSLMTIHAVQTLHLVRRRPANSLSVTQKLSWWRYKSAVSTRWNFDLENGILRARGFCWQTSSFVPGVVKLIKYTVCTGRVLFLPLPGNTGSSEACQHFWIWPGPSIRWISAPSSPLDWLENSVHPP